MGEPEEALALAREVAPESSDDELQAFATMIRQSASPGAALALNRMNDEIDVRDVLPAIRVPTLVLNREGEHPFIRQGSAYLAQHIAGARYVELPGSSHAPFAGDSESYVRAIEGFLQEAWAEEASAEPEPDRVLATILFTDIVGSTEKAAELGDRAWAELVERHYALVRRSLDLFRGREVDTAGDGFFAAFDGPIRAIECARTIVSSAPELGLEVRTGLHTGVCELRLEFGNA